MQMTCAVCIGGYRNFKHLSALSCTWLQDSLEVENRDDIASWSVIPATPHPHGSVSGSVEYQRQNEFG